jgi:hypothetical protein
MKVRNGFVSNSSSSSFLIYGFCMESDAFISLMRESKFKDVIEEEWELDSYEILRQLKKAFKKEGVEIETGWESEYSYIGLDPRSIGDDETGKEFRERVESSVGKVFGEKKKCSWHEEAWRDG